MKCVTEAIFCRPLRQIRQNQGISWAPVKSVKLGAPVGPPFKSVKVPVKTSGRPGPLPPPLLANQTYGYARRLVVQE